MSDAGRHRNHPVFLVAVGPYPWADMIWGQEISRLPSEWHRVGTPSELIEWLVRHHQNAPRYIFFIFWPWRVGDDIVRRYECVNFHMTALPYGRGGSPLQNLILRGHRHTTLTAHRMTEELDAGPIYDQHPLTLDGRAEEIYRRAAWPIAVMIRTIITFHPTPQSQEGEVVAFRRRTPEQSDIRTKPPEVPLYDFIRMLDAPGYPAAYVEQGGVRYKFTHAQSQEDGTLTARVQIVDLQELWGKGKGATVCAP